MSSTATAPSDLSKAIPGLNGQSVTGFASQHPWAPRINSIELPLINEESTQQHMITINHGDGQWIPRHLLFRNNISQEIDYRLALQNEPRAIAQPFFTCVPANPESLWGAVGIAAPMGDDDIMSISFERGFDQATEPPVIRMVIRTDMNNFITVDAEQGSSYVTVVDVQRAVIQWMKERRAESGGNDLTRRFSRWVRMVDDDGTEVEVEIWVWKGLKPLSMDMINWHLHLCEV